ncbi:MAG: MBL fold metallo-hydrolase [Anaerovoracaceae bacterium]
MKMKRFIGGLLESNGYIIYNKLEGDCYIIDPGYEAGKFMDFVKKNKLKLNGILLTHHHYDHVGAVKKIRNETDCPVYLHREDMDQYKDEIDVTMEDGDIILLGDEEIKVIHTPGHTMGGVCFYSEKSKLVFTGDTIFNVDLGRTDLEDGSEQMMVNSILNVVDKWSNEIFIYPGHGDGCNMKKVRKINQEFLKIMEGK